MTRDAAARFVAQTTLPIVRTVAASMPDLRREVIDHPDLEEDLWFSFYRTKKLPPVSEAKSLVGRILSDAQILHVLERETRTRVLVDMVRANRFTTSQLDALTGAKSCTAPVVDALLETQPDTLSHEWLRAAGLKAGGAVLLEYFCQATDEEISDEEMGAHLRRYSEWGPTWAQARMTRLIHRRPGVIADAIASGHPQFLTVIAGSRLIADVELQYQVAGLRDPEAAEPRQVWLDARAFTWMALAWNPVTSLEVVQALDPLLQRQQVKPDACYAATDRQRSKPAPVTVGFDEVTDPAQLSWLIQRTVSKPRPEDLEILVRNPHLGPGEAARLLTCIVREEGDALAALATSGSPVGDAVLALAARFPEEAGPDYAEQLAVAHAAATRPSTQPRPFEDGPAREFSAEELDTAGALHISWLTNRPAARVRLERELNPNPATWQFALSKLDEFSGTVDDLVVVANAVGAAA